MVTEESRLGIERYFRAYVRLITSVAAFKYFGHILMAMKNDWPAVVANLWKSQ